MANYRITLQFEADDDDAAMAAGRKQQSAMKGSKMVSAELQRAYYWEPIWVDDEAANDPAAPRQVAASG